MDRRDPPRQRLRILFPVGICSRSAVIDCTNARNTVALILCSGPEGARADWDLNSAWWALYFTVNDTGRRQLDLDQQVWRQSLDRICALPRQLTQEEQSGQAMAQAGRRN
jgi:uncharacterized protein YecT (DUF1311 family)